MLKVGITGAMGSGKTTVCKIFQTLGIPVYFADPRSKELLEHDPDVREEMSEAFGKSIYDESGKLKRKELAGIVFNDRKKLKILEGIAHPAVKRDFERWAANFRNVPYVLKEAALLLESGSYKSLDKLLVVTAPEKIRLERVKKRDDVTEEEIKKRTSNQWSEQEKVNRADYLIVNDGKEMLIPQVLNLHKELLTLSKNI